MTPAQMAALPTLNFAAMPRIEIRSDGAPRKASWTMQQDILIDRRS
jgi:hypothetical protein